MKLPYKIGLLFAVGYMVFESVCLLLNANETLYFSLVSAGVNMFCLLLAVVLGVLLMYKKGNSFLNDIKKGLQSGSIYALFVTLFVFSYHKWLAPNYMNDRKTQFEKRMNNPEFRALAQKKMRENPKMYEGKTIDDAIQMNKASMNMVLDSSPQKIVPMTLFSLLLLAMFYTFFITGLNRFVLSKLR